MKPTILPLSDPQADLETVGGKGMSLARLARAGLPVPGGFHVTTGVYRRFVAENQLQPRILKALKAVNPARPATLEAASDAIGQLFAGAAIPADLADAIAQAYAALPGENPAVAVRSSATAEDLPEASFAGQQETYLNVRGLEAVLKATCRCWASLWTGRAIAYRLRQGIDPQDVALAVVVQLLVPADAAGILFTANPLNGRRGEAVINAAWGLGEAVVGGAVTPDTITVDRATGGVVRREISTKQVMTVRTEDGTCERPVPASLQAKPALSDKQAVELARCGTRIEDLYGRPMDIEWVLLDGRFSIVQARPITALPEAPIEWIRPDPKGIFLRGSIVDLMPAPLSPLFLTLGFSELRNQMKPLGERLIGSGPDLGPYYFSSINAYAYMSSNFPVRGWLWVLFHMLPAYPRLIRSLVPLWRDELHPEYQAFVAGLQDKLPGEMSGHDLWQTSQEIVVAAMYYACALMFATMGASAGSEMLLTRVYEKMARQEGDPPASALLMGWDNIPIRAEKSLYDLARWCRERGRLAAHLLQTDSGTLAAQLSDGQTPAEVAEEDWKELQVRFARHLDQFGHVVFQLDFAEQLPRDCPEPMLENIKMYLRGEGVNPHERQQASQARRIETGEAVLGRLTGFRRWAFRIALHWGQSLAAVREDALAEIGLGYPALRAMLHELGRRFVEAGAIEEAQDIFWLEKEEIEALVSGGEGPSVVCVVERKATYERLKAELPPPMIPMKERIMGIKSEIFVAHSADAQKSSTLQGVAASPGVVTAPARVLLGSQDFDQMRPGEVLVAGTTTPAWTPLFAMASAVVTDIGGPLSHGSIVAREYGIPAVMGTGVATRRIHSGQVITIDGNQGIVTLVDAEEQAAGTASPPTEWVRPDPQAIYARGSLAEHTPSPVSPLFATLGLEIANRETDRLWTEVLGSDKSRLIRDGFYKAINGYVYGGFHLTAREAWLMTKTMLKQTGGMMRASVERWQAGRARFAAVVEEWEAKEIEAFSPSELLEGVRTVFAAAIHYYTVIQSTLPAASTSELLFGRFYRSLVKRKDDPEMTVFLFGYENLPVRAEQSLFDIAAWAGEQTALADYISRTPTEALAAALQVSHAPRGVPAAGWKEWQTRIAQHFKDYGRTFYEYDFACPTPVEAPGPALEAIKAFLAGQAGNPHARLQAAAERREQASAAVLGRLGWPRRGWFERLLHWTRAAGGIREDSIFDMGMAHPLIRRMLAELGRRFTAGGAIESSDDIYWLEGREVEELVALLGAGSNLPVVAQQVPARKAQWRAALKISPPVMLPERSGWRNLIGGGEAREKDGKVVLKGLGTGGGQVTAPACVLFSPEDFGKMKPGDVLVATTTTPAWTPLFALASAVVTDIGGPLSHSSIVAREYGIPAVMAARGATRQIRDGQTITVDGKVGTVTLE
ncbi:MAG: hypothetical protein JXB85_00335 [Anaerolineales bacterium]|nr:hypothetical protein [Anaerolineales bacterium]